MEDSLTNKKIEDGAAISTRTTRLPWFPCYPSKLLGALAAMTSDEQLVYIVTLLRIYEVGGPVADDAVTLSRRTGLSARRVAAAVARLVETGKLVGDSDRGWMNPVAREEIQEQMRRAETASAKAKTASTKRWKNRQQNQQNENAPSIAKDTSAMLGDAHKHQHEHQHKKQNVGSGDPTPADLPSRKRSKRPKAPPSYTEEFENFWQPYPRTPIMSKAEAFEDWNKLSDQDRGKAIAAVPGYVAYLKSKPDQPVVHACRFISQRRFDGFVESTAANQVIGVFIKVGTDQWKAWDTHYRVVGGPGGARDMPPAVLVPSRGVRGNQFPTEWPPGHRPAALPPALLVAA
jgi:uncharacterized protein YdaU (DUF1376 family)